MANRYVLPLVTLRMADVARVGGKNASLGELISQLAASGVRVPGGFATTAGAFDDFLAHNQLAERINQALAKIDVEDVGALAKAGAQIRRMVEAGTPPPQIHQQGLGGYGPALQRACDPGCRSRAAQFPAPSLPTSL